MKADRGRAADSGFGRRVMLLATGTLSGHLVTAAVTPAVARLYAPSDFAVIGVFVSLLAVIVVASDGGYSRAIPLPDSDAAGASLLVISAAIVGAATAAAAIGVWQLRDQIAAWTNAAVLGRYLWWLPVMVLVAGLYQVCNFWAIRRHAYNVIGRARVEVSVGQALVILVLGVARIGGVGLIIGDAVGSLIGTCRLAHLVWRRDRTLIRGVTWTAVRAAAGRYAYFPLFVMPAALLMSLQTKISILMVASLYGVHAAGSLTFAHGVLWVLTTVISDAVAQVYLGRGAELARRAPDDLRRLFNRTARWLLTMLAPPLAVAGMFAPLLFVTVFGADWLEAGSYVRILVPALIARLVVGPIFQTLTILDRQAWVFWTNALSVGLITAGFVLSHQLGWAAESAIILYSALLCVTYTVLFFLARKAIAHVVDVDVQAREARYEG